MNRNIQVSENGTTVSFLSLEVCRQRKYSWKAAKERLIRGLNPQSLLATGLSESCHLEYCPAQIPDLACLATLSEGVIGGVL